MDSPPVRDRSAFVCPTYQVSAAPAERKRGRRLLQTVVGQHVSDCRTSKARPRALMRPARHAPRRSPVRSWRAITARRHAHSIRLRKTSPPTQPVRDNLPDIKASRPSSSARSARTACHQTRSLTATCPRARHDLGRRGKMVCTAAGSRHELADRLDVAEGDALPPTSLATTSMVATFNASDNLTNRVRADLPVRTRRTTPLTEQRPRRHDHRASRSTACRSNLRL